LHQEGSWVPHLYCWKEAELTWIAWEFVTAGESEHPLGAAVARPWLADKALLYAAVRIAAKNAVALEGASVEYFSTRWLIRNEWFLEVAQSNSDSEIGHVSLHVSEAEEETLVELLTTSFGMIQISRPSAIKTPGTWLLAGNSTLHLNSRAIADGPEVSGTAPNHLCLMTLDLDLAQQSIESAGYSVIEAGSLGNQIWFRLRSGTMIEVQSHAKRSRW
jgi:hypothetical protein